MRKVGRKFPNATGQTFNKVTILEDKIGKENSRARIRCECGAEKIVGRYDVFNSKIKSCGETKCGEKWIDITGQRFDQLLVIKYVGPSHNKHTIIWECQCNCGNIVHAKYCQLITNHKKSCGCIKGERISNAQCSLDNIACENIIWNSYKLGAVKRNLEFSIEKSQFVKLLYGNCYYCDSEPLNCMNRKLVTKQELFFYNGIDRIDNSIGYLPENCVSCCKICNKAKSNHTVGEFLIWLRKVNCNFQKIENKFCEFDLTKTLPVRVIYKRNDQSGQQ